jgi:hypothetical protein
MTVAEAISVALSRGGEEMPTPKYNPEILPPSCNEEDLKALVGVIRQFNGGPVSADRLYVEVMTSEGYIDLAEKEPKYRENPATTLRIVCNATIDSGEVARFKPGYKRTVQLQLKEATPNIQLYDKGRIIPLSVDGNYFGIALITNKEFNRYGRPQFGLIFDVVLDPNIRNADAVLFNLLKSQT